MKSRHPSLRYGCLVTYIKEYIVKHSYFDDEFRKKLARLESSLSDCNLKISPIERAFSSARRVMEGALEGRITEGVHILPADCGLGKGEMAEGFLKE